MITVAIVDNDKYVRQGIADQVNRVSTDFEVVGTYGSVADMLNDSNACMAAVVLLDVIIGSGNQLDANLSALQDVACNIVAITTDTDRPEIARALRQHPASIAHKNDLTDSALEFIIRHAAQGGRHVSADVAPMLISRTRMPSLTPAMMDLLNLMVTGMPVNAAANRLGIQPDTAYKRLDDIEDKFIEAGYPIRSEGESDKRRPFAIINKAREIGIFLDHPGS